jgi:hypothetical protein
MAWAILAFALLAGCTKHVLRAPSQRVTLGYTDQRFFAITHYDAIQERSASTGWKEYAGRLAGRACGVDVTFFGEYHGSTLQLTGFVKPMDPSKGVVISGVGMAGSTGADKPSYLEVRDRHTSHGIERTIAGKIGGDDMAEFSGAVDGSQGIVVARAALAPRRHEIDLHVSFDHFWGEAGYRKFDLHADGDTYVGTLVFNNSVKLPFRMRGRGSLWSMPAADQAVILPFVITCLIDDRKLLQDVDLSYIR